MQNVSWMFWSSLHRKLWFPQALARLHDPFCQLPLAAFKSASPSPRFLHKVTSSQDCSFCFILKSPILPYFTRHFLLRSLHICFTNCLLDWDCFWSHYPIDCSHFTVAEGKTATRKLGCHCFNIKNFCLVRDYVEGAENDTELCQLCGKQVTRDIYF